MDMVSKLSFVVACLCALVHLSQMCFPEYVPDVDVAEIREHELNANFISESVDGPGLAKARPEHDPACGCGVQSYPSFPADQLKLENMKSLTVLPLYPWHVLIVFTNSDKKCAGTIINDQFILTNAQCFIEISDYITLMDALFGTKPENLPIDHIRIYTNVKNPTNENYKQTETQLYAKDVIIHPNFTLSYFADGIIDYDFALVQLKERLNLGLFTPICLPKGPIKFEKRNVIAAGWGKETNNHFLRAPRFYEPGDFRDIYHFGHYFDEQDNVCSDFVNTQRIDCLKTVRQYIGEDGYGGPLMIKDHDRIFQIGIFSYHRQPEVDIVTNVIAVLRFIDHFSKKAGSKWCSSTEGSKPYFPWDSKKISNRKTKSCECGKNPPQPRPGRVQGGLPDGNPNAFPWLVLINNLDDEFGSIGDKSTAHGKKISTQCTGSLISDRMILTSTDCILHKLRQWDGLAFKDDATVDQMIVYFGGLRRVDKRYQYILDRYGAVHNGPLALRYPPISDIRYAVKDVYFFPNYVRMAISTTAEPYLTNNIAVIVLKDPPDRTPICLQRMEDPLLDILGSEISLVGYGRTDFREIVQQVPHPYRADEIYDYESDTRDMSNWWPHWLPVPLLEEKLIINKNPPPEKLLRLLPLDDPYSHFVFNPGFSIWPLATFLIVQDLKLCSNFTDSLISNDFICTVEEIETGKINNEDILLQPKHFPGTPLLGDFGAPISVAPITVTKDRKYTQIGSASYSMYHTELMSNRIPPLSDKAGQKFPALHLKVKGLIPFIEYIADAVDAEFCAN